MVLKSLVSVAAVVLAGISLSACNEVNSVARNAKFSPSMQASVASVTTYAEANANPTEFGQAPVDLWIFELTDPDELMSADFISLTEQPKQTLSTSYVKHYKKQVTPKSSSFLAPFELDRKTTYIGIAVGYANLDKTKWRAVERVNALGENYQILIPITQKGVTIQIHR